MRKCPISILLKAGAPWDWEGKEEGLTFTIPFGTSDLNSFFGPNLPSPLTPSPGTHEKRDLGRKEEESSRPKSQFCPFCPGDF